MYYLQMQDWKIMDQISWQENAGLENDGPNVKAAKCKTAK
jgi:hypothetical protein